MNKGIKVLIGAILCVAIAVAVIVCCNINKNNKQETSDAVVTVSEEKEVMPEPTRKAEEDKPSEEISEVETVSFLGGLKDRRILEVDFDNTLPQYTPSVPSYAVDPGCANVVDIDRFYLSEGQKNKLAENGFFVSNYNGSEFFDQYEFNRYMHYPSFVTTDSIMHTYHLYFAMLQKNTEKQYLVDQLVNLTSELYNNSITLYDELKGTEWENAATMNVAYFTVASKLLGINIEVKDYVSEIADAEFDKINAAEGIDTSMITGEYEDYSQFKPRGYYEGDPLLEKYFRTMMLYGRVNLMQSKEEHNRMALLMTMAMDDEAYAAWEKIYSVTAFFAGNSDDAGYCEYLSPAIEAYGQNIEAKAIIGNETGWNKFNELISKIEPPKINSCVFDDNGGQTDRLQEGKGFRLMGQRFSVDAAVFTQLCYSKVLENSEGEKRTLPDALDVPAAMGSDEALSILSEQGNSDYKNYIENMEKTRKALKQAPESLWSSSLYGGWMNTLSPLLRVKGQGYPMFMNNKAWTRKNLETYLGSWTELKHDTVLYSKQFVAEMGGDDYEKYDDRGYVEPEPELYSALATLTDNTIEGLDGFGILSDENRENLEILKTMANSLKEISVKELNCEQVTDKEYDFIREYGGNLEHLWRKTIDNQDYFSPSEYPCALVTDVATDPDGAVLEEAVGGASNIYVAFPMDGEVHLGVGTVFSYYQFVVPISERMTDSQWRQDLGLELNENMEYGGRNDIERPYWTSDYRVSYE